MEQLGQDSAPVIIRVCDAVVRGGRIMMVCHRHNGRSYWTLPGGGVEADEAPEKAAERELERRASRLITGSGGQ